ncbi:MAG: type II toxin-antitoxin system PemK/MazF family toxin [Nitrospirae bacterium]|nr:MAG: type II toxin-antitoxin system PemK/MazF family toxin [Nitrospirota bacterium]
MLKQRDVVLIPIPFTDLTSQKKRPAVIVSSDSYNATHEDIVVVALTSNIEPRDFSVSVTSDDLEVGILKVPSIIRVDKIYTLNKTIVVQVFGRVTHDILRKINEHLLVLTEQVP